MKLIKRNEEHYIIVDGFEVKKGDYIYESDQNNINIVGHDYSKNNKDFRITYSTKPLEDIIRFNNYIGKGWVNIKQLSLSEVEELLFGYSVEKLVDESFENMGYHSTVTPYEEKQFKLGYKLGFNAHKELVKNKLFTVDDMLMFFKHGILFNQETVSNCKEAVETEFDLLIKSIKPKTEWEVEFINEKLTLKQ